MAKRDPGRTVYSSEHGRMCPHCGLPERRCQCRANPRGGARLSNSDGDGIARVGRTSKGRGGKTVTLVTGIQLPPDELSSLAKLLKRRCGTGGAVKDEVIEIQGDQRDVVVEELEGRGFKVKRSGG
ncbi:MAG: translation initiation factor Sui1 [Deltaproteobacteria bacterium]|nr:translation initiation factor Sui1 [Deltaproteobacteria bacterium]MBW2384666.1 translation initiation factor Sui1 [Deltaproteobacteria bacterium]MBW2696419.1 translation initiation factor Sui1 [Deltaproteobacteria bacterium]